MTGESVTKSIGRQFPFTFFLSILSLFMALIWGIPFGVLSAHPLFKRFEKLFDLFPLIFLSIPVFVSAPLLIWFFGVYLSWFPVSGAGAFSYLCFASSQFGLAFRCRFNESNKSLYFRSFVF